MDETIIRRTFYVAALIGLAALAIALFLAWSEGKWTAWIIGLIAGLSYFQSTLLLLSRRNLKEFDALILNEQTEVTSDEIKHTTSYVPVVNERLVELQKIYIFTRQGAVPAIAIAVLLGLYFLLWLSVKLFELLTR